MTSWVKCKLDRSQSDFYFVPQEIQTHSHSQAGSTSANKRFDAEKCLAKCEQMWASVVSQKEREWQSDNLESCLHHHDTVSVKSQLLWSYHLMWNESMAQLYHNLQGKIGFNTVNPSQSSGKDFPIHSPGKDKWWIEWPHSTKTRELLGNPPRLPSRFPRTSIVLIIKHRYIPKYDLKLVIYKKARL